MSITKAVLTDLPEDALAAWQAYNAMEATKSRHFELLTSLEKKYRHHGSASADERALLSRLLQDHDHQVGAFKRAMASLREKNPGAHDRLVGYIAAMNSALMPYDSGEPDANPN